MSQNFLYIPSPCFSYLLLWNISETVLLGTSIRQDENRMTLEDSSWWSSLSCIHSLSHSAKQWSDVFANSNLCSSFFPPMQKYARERGADRQEVYVALKTWKNNWKMGQQCQKGQQENNFRAKETVFWGPVKIVTLCMQKTNLIIFPTEWEVPML